MKNRVVYLDILRVIASFAVVLLHVAATCWRSIHPSTIDWQALNFYDSLSRFCVPVLVMISGVLFLNDQKEISIKQLYQKYIFRLLIVYIIFASFYAISEMYFLSQPFSIKLFIQYFLNPEVHLWFLPMMIGLYILLPILKTFINQKSIASVKYALVLFLGFAIVKTTLLQLPIPETMKSLLDVIPLEFFVGYVGYFILGYYLNYQSFSSNQRKIIYTLGILSIIVTFAYSYFISIQEQKAIGMLFNYFSITTFFTSCAIFIFVKEFVNKRSISKKTIHWIFKISNYTFGVYLIHIVVKNFFYYMEITPLIFHPIWWVPVLTIIIYMISLGFSILLKHIPYLKEYL